MIKILIRNILQYKSISAINMVGLGLGLAIGSIIFLFVDSELSYDTFHTKADRLYRVAHDRTTLAQASHRASTPLALSARLKDIEAIEMSARFLRDGGGILQYKEKSYTEPQFCFADPQIFEMFDFKFIKGSKNKWSEQPNGLIISETIAEKYFGKEDPIGKIFQYRNWGQQYTYQVSAVIKDIPQNCHFRFEIFAPFDGPNNLWNDMHGSDWFHSGVWTYVLLKDEVSTESLQPLIQRAVQDHLPDELKNATVFYLQPIRKIYLNSHLSDEIELNGDRSYVIMLSIIGVLIQLLACINFVNLSTARSIERSKEVGVRKALGAFRSQLVSQFLRETVFVALASSLLAILIIPLLLPYFNFITGKVILVNYLSDPSIVIYILGVGVVMGLLAGIYPAFVLSGYKPANVLRLSSGIGGGSHGTLRKVLVALQFTAALILLIGVLTVRTQLNYIESKELGYNKDNIVFLQGYDFRKAKQLKHQLRELAEITEVTTSRGVPGSESASFDTRLIQTDRTDLRQRLESYYFSADNDFLDFFEIQLVAGRNFSPEFVADSAESILVNEAMIKKTGWEGDPIGREVEVFNMLGNPVGKRTVIGVIKDFNFQTLHNEVRPLAMGLTSRSWNIAFRVNSNDPFATVNKAKSIAALYSNDNPIEVHFLDQDMSHQYLKEERMSNMVYLFTTLAIIIASIGLFGLSSFAAQRKSKEIAIRKVFGASSGGVAIRFTTEFTVLVVISFALAVPISYFLLESWLSTFAYRVQQGSLTYFIALGIAIALTWITVMFYALRAAMSNPVKSLKEE